MTLPRKILVVSRESVLPASAGLRNSEVLSTVVDTISDAWRLLQRAGYDAVFLRVDGPGEISFILRVKAAAPDTQLIALLSSEDPALETLARESGADEIIPDGTSGSRSASKETVTLSTAELLGRSRMLKQEFRAFRRELQHLRARIKTVRAIDFDPAEFPQGDFRPLLIEDDPDHALLLSRTFLKSGLPFPLPVMSDGEEALAYLSGTGKYADRRAYPFPTLVITDLDLPGMSGHDVIQRIRSHPALSSLIVFMLTSSQSREDWLRALELGADQFFVKPLRLDSLADLSKSLALRWALLREAQRFKPG